MANDTIVPIRMPGKVWEMVKKLAETRGMAGSTLVRSLIMAELVRLRKREKAS